MDTEELTRIREALRKVQVASVKIVLSKSKVVPGVPNSGLWPRITLRLDGRDEKVALTEYADSKKAHLKAGKPSKMEVTILRIAGVQSRSMKAVYSRVKFDLREAEARVMTKVYSTVSKAKGTNKLSSRIEGAHRERRKSAAVKAMEEVFRRLLFHGTVKVEDMRGAQVAKVWERIKSERVVADVHDR